ncbi:uncharacterized protein [Primulina eburnea]|uniref:uncharacterized protein n=1 Tax=Primulina eburnea TaxID=1245227 RepID=UPI003C6C00BD
MSYLLCLARRLLHRLITGLSLPSRLEYNNNVSRFISRQFKIQTCDTGYLWKYVTLEQRQWYWEQFCLRYRWSEAIDAKVRALWTHNIAILYRRTIHGWRSKNRYPQSVPQERWASWNAAWQQQDWQSRAAKNKANRNSEPAGTGRDVEAHGRCEDVQRARAGSASSSWQRSNFMGVIRSYTSTCRWIFRRHTIPSDPRGDGAVHGCVGHSLRWIRA